MQGASQLALKPLTVRLTVASEETDRSAARGVMQLTCVTLAQTIRQRAPPSCTSTSPACAEKPSPRNVSIVPAFVRLQRPPCIGLQREQCVGSGVKVRGAGVMVQVIWFGWRGVGAARLLPQSPTRARSRAAVVRW